MRWHVCNTWVAWIRLFSCLYVSFHVYTSLFMFTGLCAWICVSIQLSWSLWDICYVFARRDLFYRFLFTSIGLFSWIFVSFYEYLSHGMNVSLFGSSADMFVRRVFFHRSLFHVYRSLFMSTGLFSCVGLDHVFWSLFIYVGVFHADILISLHTLTSHTHFTHSWWNTPSSEMSMWLVSFQAYGSFL